jgi:hypothetical protein
MIFVKALMCFEVPNEFLNIIYTSTKINLLMYQYSLYFVNLRDFQLNVSRT